MELIVTVMKSFFFFFLLLLLLEGCRHDHAAEMPAAPVCDTLHPSYKLCVKPVLVNNCYRCHSAAVTGHGNLGFDLEDFDSLKTYLQLQYRGDGIYGSKFMAVIGDSLYIVHMPPSVQLPQGEIRQIDRWITEGAQDN